MERTPMEGVQSMPRTNSTTIPGVQQQLKKSGKVYYRHRKTGQHIDAEPGTQKFEAELKRLNAIVAERDAAKAAAVTGTLGALIKAYRASPEFANLAPRTREDYAHKLDYLRPGEMAFLDGFERAEVLRIRDTAHRAKKWHFANYLVTVMGAMFKWGIDRDYLKSNPAAGIEKIGRPKHLPQRNRAWTADERAVVLAETSGGIRAIVALGMFAGCREQDAVDMTWGAIGKDGWIRWKMGKTGDKQALPIDPRLAAILAETRGETIPLPSRHIGVGSRSGAPYTLNGFRAIFFRILQRLEHEGRIGDGLTFHGLRHTIGADLATGGASTKTIQTVLGHRSSAMAEHYAKEYSKTELALAGARLLFERDAK